MLDPTELYELQPDIADLPAPVLVHGMQGFVDAGNAVRLATDHLLATCDHELVATFDVDQLFDYRARRPVMTFVEDHWEDYDDPQLVVHALRDADGTAFLLLTGPEPDVQWERFAAAIRRIVEQLGVRLTIGLNAIPMAVPHTRPVGITAHGVPRELFPGYEPWIQTVKVPGSAGHLMEHRLIQAGHPAMGFAVHVPHYLAQAVYVDASEAIVSAVARAAGLVLPTDDLHTAALSARVEIDEQVAASDEVAAVVHGLEQQYDAFVAGRGQRSLLVEDTTEMPTADELGAELERFLADQHRQGDGSGS